MSTSPKTESRTFAFQFLYHVISQDLKISKENLESSLDEFIDSIGTPDNEVGDSKYSLESVSSAKGLISEFLIQKEDVSDKVFSCLHLKNWERLTAVEKTLINLGSFEILNSKKKAGLGIINDFVELAKKFGGPESYSLVNGVLDSVRKTNI